MKTKPNEEEYVKMKVEGWKSHYPNPDSAMTPLITFFFLVLMLFLFGRQDVGALSDPLAFFFLHTVFTTLVVDHWSRQK